ncbi:MAG: ribose-phosphate pyrophosphokinase [Planctomycetes bacterium]|nr:ribose-phosphate pyrophosphokinase [Planctomycetota bacterium]
MSRKNKGSQQRYGALQVIAGSANRPLAEAAAKSAGVRLTKCEVTRFLDGEFNVQVAENVRGNDVFVVQPTCSPVNENLMELILLIDACRRASAGRITAVIPYYGYARKDRKDEGRVPISAKVVANMLTVAGANRVVALELHAAQIQGFFDIPVDHLYSAPVFKEHFRKKRLRDPKIVAPDVGGIKIARAYARRLHGGLAIVDKRRVQADEAEAMHLIGEVKGCDVVLIDDLISTGGTMVEAVRVVRDHGCRRVFLAATHGVFCGPAIERLRAADVEDIAVTDSIPLPAAAKDLVTVLPAGALLGRAIKCIHLSKSVSSLFVD